MALLLASGSIAHNAAAEALSPSHLFDQQQVTASSLPTTSAAASQHVTLLSRADLDAMRGLSLSEILQRQAGLVIDNGSRNGGFGSLFLRGADPSHVVVLIDHVRQNDPLSSRGSAVDLNTLSTDDIERIEIVRGNASVVNADAMAGLIHIFTRRGTSGTTLGAHYGGDGLRGVSAAWAGADLRLSASTREDGEGKLGQHRARAANLAWEHGHDDRLMLAAGLRISDSDNTSFPDDSGGARHAVLRSLESRDSDSHQLSLRSDVDLLDNGSLQISAASVNRSTDGTSPGVAPGLRDPFGLPAIDSRSDYRRDELQALWLVPFRADVLLSIGAQYQREQATLDSRIHFGAFDIPAEFSDQRITRSVFSEARWRHADWTVQAGLRREQPSNGDSTTHPTLSLQHVFGEQKGQWGASIARSSKLPSFYALGHPIVGNPALKPERASHRELYYANSAEAPWPTRLTLFSARYQDLVDFDSGPPPQLVNRARIHADGLEWRSTRAFDNGWLLLLDGAWMRVRDPDGAVVLRHRPRVQGSAQLRVPLADARDFSFVIRHLGRRLDSSIATGDLWLDAATTLDVSMQQSIGSLRLNVGLSDVFNAGVEETIGNFAPGRRLHLAVDWPLP